MPIEEIPEITIPTIWTSIPFVPVPQPSKTITLPVVNMPCALGRKDFTPNTEIYTDDPAGNLVLCPGIPSFEPIQYNRKDIQIINTQKPQIAPPPENTASAPEATPPPTEDIKENVPCPDETKNNPRIGDISASGKEKVSGFELRDGTCVVLYEPVTAVETYLPRPGVVTTTSLIASAAVVSSVLAKPLADLILKIIKPSIKKIIDGLKKKILKKEPKKVSAFEHRMAQRERNRAFRKLKKGW